MHAKNGFCGFKGGILRKMARNLLIYGLTGFAAMVLVAVAVAGPAPSGWYQVNQDGFFQPASAMTIFIQDTMVVKCLGDPPQAPKIRFDAPVGEYADYSYYLWVDFDYYPEWNGESIYMIYNGDTLRDELSISYDYVSLNCSEHFPATWAPQGNGIPLIQG